MVTVQITRRLLLHSAKGSLAPFALQLPDSISRPANRYDRREIFRSGRTKNEGKKLRASNTALSDNENGSGTCTPAATDK